jgi:diguanylate cyclase (GGDEF)-like protein/PAS domain S-box-containing protein
MNAQPLRAADVRVNSVLGRVLVIEADARLRASVEELLQLSGMEVVAPAGTASAGGALAKAGSGAFGNVADLIKNGRFDAVVLDPRALPDDYVQLLEVARAAHSKVVILSADPRIDAALAAFRGGAYDFLRKPYDPDHLIRTLHAALKRGKSAESAPQARDGAHWFQQLADSSPDVVYALDQEGRFTFVNARIEQLLGIARDELIGKHYSVLVHESDRERARRVFDERRTGKRASTDLELRLVGRARADDPLDQRSKVVTVQLSACGLYQGEVHQSSFVGSCGFARDVTARKRAEEQVHFRAYHDLLTGLPNRLLLRDHLQLALAQAKRTRGTLAVMFIDLDRFKQVNDTLGHAAGDQLLQAVAARLSNCIREGDTLARLGGDEFLLLLPHLDGREAAANTARKLLEALSTPFNFGKQELFVGASIGICFFPDDADSADALIHNADRAMYDAKAQGRNTHVFYSAAKHLVPHARMGLEQEIERALANGEFMLYYQPQLDARNKQLAGFEALLRWQHPTRGIVTAEDFLAHAEDTRHMAPLGEWVLGAALAQARRWIETGLKDVNLAINMSTRQLYSRDFLQRFAVNLARAQIDPARIAIEISETRMLRDLDLVHQRLRTLARMGVRVCIDNFGTGGVSFNQLRSLPVNAVKLDRSLVQEIKPEDEEHAIARALMLVAQAMKVDVFAHGVENEYQLDFLREHGCHAWQGYLYSKPLPAQEATQLLAVRSAGRVPE